MKFSELLEEYLNERDKQNSDYYENRPICDRGSGLDYMYRVAEKLDELCRLQDTDNDRT